MEKRTFRRNKNFRQSNTLINQKSLDKTETFRFSAPFIPERLDFSTLIENVKQQRLDLTNENDDDKNTSEVTTNHGSEQQKPATLSFKPPRLVTFIND